MCVATLGGIVHFCNVDNLCCPYAKFQGWKLFLNNCINFLCYLVNIGLKNRFERKSKKSPWNRRYDLLFFQVVYRPPESCFFHFGFKLCVKVIKFFSGKGFPTPKMLPKLFYGNVFCHRFICFDCKDNKNQTKDSITKKVSNVSFLNKGQQSNVCWQMFEVE